MPIIAAFTVLTVTFERLTMPLDVMLFMLFGVLQNQAVLFGI